MKSEISLDTININVHSNNSSRPGTKEIRNRNNKSLKELMQDRSLMNYEQLDRINLADERFKTDLNSLKESNVNLTYIEKNESYNQDSMTSIPTVINNNVSSKQNLIDPKRPNTSNAQR